MRRGAALLLWVFVCSAAAQQPNPILYRDRSWAFDGFAVVPPRNGPWSSLSKTRDRAVFVRHGENPHTSSVATVVAHSPAETFATPERLLDYAKAMRGKTQGQSAYTLVEHLEWLEEIPAEGAWCTRYRLKGEERQSLWEATWFVEIEGRSCWHAAARLFIDLNLSERALPAAATFDLAAEAAGFLQSLRLLPNGSLQQDIGALERAGREGDGRAALRLGEAHLAGTVLPKDSQRAEHWLRLAAAEGEADALYNLGVLYEKGLNGRRDVEQALKWFSMAADQRDAQAQLNLGLLFYRGEDIPADAEAAFYWLSLAAGNGSERARQLLRPSVPPP